MIHTVLPSLTPRHISLTLERVQQAFESFQECQRMSALIGNPPSWMRTGPRVDDAMVTALENETVLGTVSTASLPRPSLFVSHLICLEASI